METGQLIRGVRETAEITGWKAVILDVDDTIAESSPLWGRGFTYVGEKTAEYKGVKAETVAGEAKRWNNELYKNLGVHPRKYRVIAGELAREFEVEETRMWEWMKTAVAMIYCRAPELFAETTETLEVLVAAGLRVGFATHSSLGRTKILKEAWGWEDKYPVFTQSMLTKKDERIWKKATEGLKVRPEQAVAVGDNLHGDILAARRAGIKDTVWVKPAWQIYAQGEKPDGLVVINGIGQLAAALIENFG
jgi:HAD superfamily hydrolase (TIGR01549 family)